MASGRGPWLRSELLERRGIDFKLVGTRVEIVKQDAPVLRMTVRELLFEFRTYNDRTTDLRS
ncbi:MAG: hypothetical protein CMJ48_02835 [Planctomycetaceae bacterium]|nr:hypothetical protein [Planctomycetaceae bacterium]